MTPTELVGHVEHVSIKESFGSNWVSPHRFGLVFGTFVAAVHAFWAVLVWTGLAQPLMDFIFRLHMIRPVYRIAEFNLGTAAALVVFTAAAGYVFGWVLGILAKHLTRV